MPATPSHQHNHTQITMSVAADKRRENVILLDSDDDTDVARMVTPTLHGASESSSSSPPLPSLSLLESSSSHLSPSSLTLPPSTSPSSLPPAPSASLDSSDDITPYTLTTTSVHEFSSLPAVTAFLNKEAAAQGFEVRVKSTGAGQGASYRCWCSHPPPSQVKTEVIASVPPRRTRHLVTSSHGGKKVKCGCQWSISVFRWADGVYRFGQRNLVHTGHDVLPRATLIATVDSLRNVSPQLLDEMRRMLINGMRCTENERRYLQAGHGVTIDRELYRNAIKKLKRELSRPLPHVVVASPHP